MQGDDGRARISRSKEGRGAAVAGKRPGRGSFGRDNRAGSAGCGDSEPRAGIGRGRVHGYTGRSGGEQRRQRVGCRPGEKGRQEPYDESRGQGPTGEPPTPQEGEEGEEKAQQLGGVGWGDFSKETPKEETKGQPATRGAKAATREPDPTDTTKGLTLRIIQEEATTHADAASRIHELCRRALTAPLPGKSAHRSKAQLSSFQPLEAGRQVIVSHTKIDVLTLTSEAIHEHLQQPDSPEWDPVDEEEELEATKEAIRLSYRTAATSYPTPSGYSWSQTSVEGWQSIALPPQLPRRPYYCVVVPDDEEDPSTSTVTITESASLAWLHMRASPDSTEVLPPNLAIKALRALCALKHIELPAGELRHDGGGQRGVQVLLTRAACKQLVKEVKIIDIQRVDKEGTITQTIETHLEWEVGRNALSARLRRERLTPKLLRSGVLYSMKR